MEIKETNREYYDKLRSYHNREQYLFDKINNAKLKGFTTNEIDLEEINIEVDDYILDNFSGKPILVEALYSTHVQYYWEDFACEFDFSYDILTEITANDKILFEVEIINDKRHFTAVDYYTALHSEKDIIFVYFKYVVDVECNVVWLYDYIKLE